MLTMYLVSEYEYRLSIFQYFVPFVLFISLIWFDDESLQVRLKA